VQIDWHSARCLVVCTTLTVSLAPSTSSTLNIPTLFHDQSSLVSTTLYQSPPTHNTGIILTHLAAALPASFPNCILEKWRGKGKGRKGRARDEEKERGMDGGKGERRRGREEGMEGGKGREEGGLPLEKFVDPLLLCMNNLVCTDTFVFFILFCIQQMKRQISVIFDLINSL